MSDVTEGYVCAACDAKPDHKCYLRNGRWLCGPCYDMERIAEFENDIASLRATIERLTALVATHLNEANEQADRAESAEATIARLAKVVRAAQRLDYVIGLARKTSSGSAERNEALGMMAEANRAIASALSSLTAADRRRAGIEG